MCYMINVLLRAILWVDSCLFEVLCLIKVKSLCEKKQQYSYFRYILFF